MNRRPVEQPVDVLRIAAVAAEQTVIAEDPQIAGPRRRLVGRFGDFVRIALAVCLCEEVYCRMTPTPLTKRCLRSWLRRGGRGQPAENS